MELHKVHDARAWLALSLLFAVACSGVDNGEAGLSGPLAVGEDDIAAAEVPGPWTGVVLGDPDLADQWIVHGRAHAGPPGSGSHAVMAVGEVIATYAHGDHDRVVDQGTRVAAALSHTDNGWWQVHAQTLVVMSKVARGDADTSEVAADVRAAIPTGRWAMLAGRIDAFEARHLVQIGRPAAALERVAAAAARERRTGNRVLSAALQPAAAAFVATGEPASSSRALLALDRPLADLGWVDLHAELTASTTAAARDALGDDQFDVHHDTGAAMSHEEVLD